MPIVVPASKNYQSPINPVPSFLNREPTEGEKYIPFEIDWATMGGPNNCVFFSLYGLSPQTWSQVCALSVDNSKCGADVQFVFTDSGQTYTVPAYAPQTVFPVFTGASNFYIVAIGAEPEDVTIGSVLNFYPAPIAVPTSQEQESAVFNNIQASVVGTTQLVPTTVSGTLENINVFFQLGESAPGTCVWEIVDGSSPTPVVLAGGQVANNSATNENILSLSLNDVHIRFQNGLQFKILTSAVPNTSAAAVNVLYRTP